MIPGTTAQRLSLSTPASDLAVREVLARIRRWLHARALTDEDRGTVELVLAEALNNIVEHAYPADTPGEIRLDLTLDLTRLVCVLSDHGTALPGLRAPDGILPAHDVARDALPEGGFGWFLIRDLADRVDYRRAAGWNHLSVEFRRAPL